MRRPSIDVRVKAAITAGLRRRGIEVVTAQEDGGTRLENGALLERATALQRMLFRQDDDLLAVARARRPPGCFSPGSSTGINSQPRWVGMGWNLDIVCQV